MTEFSKIKYAGGVGVATIAAWWVSLHVAVKLLIFLQAADVVSGLLASVVLRKTSSSIAWVSMAKKFMCWVVIAMCHQIEVLIPGAAVSIGDRMLTLGAGAALMYCWIEVVSILENAAKAEALPPALNDTLRKFLPGATPK